MRDAVTKAEALVDSLFVDNPNPPEGATLESLWAEILILKKLVKKPGVEKVAKLLLEDEALAPLSIELLSQIIKAGYAKRGFTCNCSASSLRWYISQRTLNWNIVKRG